ncbi:hypothetical protein M2H33_07235 [Vibrio vulnificus]|nr:hypothetical protein [Vibrio vulnificus]
MERTSILHHLKKLKAYSLNGAISDGMYFKMEIPESNSHIALSEIDELKKLDKNDRLKIKFREIKSSRNISVSVSKSPEFGIYDNFQSLFNEYFKLCANEDLEDCHRDFFLIKNESAFNDDKSAFDFFERLSSWMKLFKSVINNHHFEHKAEVKFYLVEEVEKDKQIKTHELVLSNAIVFNNLSTIKDVPMDFLFGQDEKYLIEKKLILKNTILKIFKEYGVDTFLKIMQCPDIFERKFSNDYEFYTHKYSLDKVMREVEKSKFEYFEKINNIIYDNQAKALVIPLVMLGTSFVRTWDLKSSVLVFISMSVAAIILLINLNHKKKAVLDCKESAFRVLGIVEEDVGSDNSKNVFIDAKVSVESKATDALSLLKLIERFLSGSIIAWALFVLLCR